MPELEVVLVVLLLGLWIYTLIDVVVSDAQAVRGLPKVVWFFAVVLLGMLFGPLLWFVLGRPRAAARRARASSASAWRAARAQHPSSRPVPRTPSRPVAPDDDPEFLEALARRLREGGSD